MSWGLQAYVILRQHYLVGGENLINEWHLQFLAQKKAAGKAPSQGGQTVSAALAAIRNIIDPSNQVPPPLPTPLIRI
jgi:hypothetical protein